MKNLMSISVTAILVVSSFAQAALTTSPYLFSDQPIPATGQFEWDEFAASFPPGPTAALGPHSPDVASFGGTGALDAFDFTTIENPPFPLITGIENIYAGGNIVDFDIELTGLSTTNSFTTVVLQLATIGSVDPSSVLLDGTVPTTFVDRKSTIVFHDTDNANAVFGTTFYWVEWQVSSDSDYTVEFANTVPHVSLAQARVEYFNTEIPFTAIAPATVPEPSSAMLIALVFSGSAFCGSRTTRD